MKRNIRYCTSAILVNCLWYVVLVYFQAKFFLGTLELSPWELLVLFQISGMTTAIVFKNQITKASEVKGLLLGLMLPFFALYAFVMPMLIYKAIFGGLGGGDIDAALFWGPFFLAKLFYLIAPLGLLSQFVMRRVYASAMIFSAESNNNGVEPTS